MSDWEAPNGGTVQVTATGLYIDGEFLEDKMMEEPHE